MADKHSEYSPSRLKGIIACPGSVQLTRQARGTDRYLEQQNEAAKHGTMLHGVMESILRAHGCVVNPPSKDLVQEHIRTLDEDDQSLIHWALNCFYEEMSQFKPEDILAWHIELPVTMEEFGFPEVFGTADLMILVQPAEDSLQLHGWDWKFGRTRVFAKDNHQLQAYKHGGYAYFLGTHRDLVWPGMPCVMHIVQPAIEHYDRWEHGLDTAWLNQLLSVMANAESLEPTFAPSEENCQWCKCRSFCKARLDQVQTLAQTVFEAFAVKPEMWDEDQVQYVFGILEVLADVRKGILEDYEQRLTEGKPVKGFKLVQGQGRRQFPDFEAVVAFLDEHHPNVEAFATKPKSPSQLEKELPLATRRSEEFQKLIQKVHGVKMVRVSEEGDAILRGAAAAQEAFKEFV